MSLSNPEFSQSKQLPPVDLQSAHVTSKGGLFALSLAAIGVVFGDIGTSPLYALKACFDPTSGIPLTHDSIFGVVSMVFWAFIFVVSLKYVLFVMQANNHGEGGILALMALAIRTTKVGTKKAMILTIVGVLGACLFYGDAVITPAISVLSALEGMQVVSDGLSPYILPMTVLILLALFLFEKKGTAIVGGLFGPIMILWFTVIGLMGIYQIINAPQILGALNPWYAIDFMRRDSAIAFTVTGSIFLVLTGAEALYADMGHFGIKPVQVTWFFLVMPCLLLNYFGQAAMFLVNPETIANPFFVMLPESFTVFLVILSTVATVIASQACISGAYSMTSQAILLGFLPRMRVLFTSEREIGQIYVPFINWVLCLVVIMVVLAFKKSDNLAAAYGIAVSTTMLMTTFLAAVVMKAVWKWNPLLVTLVISSFMVVDFGFLISNFAKILEGGWFPLVIGAICFVLMMTWYQGRQLMRRHAVERGFQIEEFLSSLMQHPPARVEGTAIFLTAHIDYVPAALLHNLKHNKVLHERVIFLKVSVWDVPRVDDAKRIAMKDLGNNMFLVRAVYGFKETPDISHILSLLGQYHNVKTVVEESSFFLARDSVVAHEIPQMSMWREHLFISMMQNASRAADFFKVDPGRVIELGTMVEL
jgi:KUP system potassium uptake protein